MHLNKQVKSLLYSSNIWYLGTGMLGPLFAIFAERVGGNVLDIAWAWATFLIVTGIMYIIVGRLVDGKSVKVRVMVSGFCLNTIFTFGYLLVSTPWHLFLVQAGLGIAAALSSPTWNALYAKFEDKRHDTFLWGLADGEGQILMGISAILGGFIVSYYSFTVLFVIMGLIQMAATLYLATTLRSLKKH